MPETPPPQEAVTVTEKVVRVIQLSGVNSTGVLESGRDFTAEGQNRYSGRLGRRELNFPTPVTAGYLSVSGLPSWRGPVNKEGFDSMLSNVGDTADFIVLKLNEILRELYGRDEEIS
jgi:hypothetical protein